VAPRYIALLVGALIVLGATVNLFREVRARPAPVTAVGSASPTQRAEAPATPEKPFTPPPPMTGAARVPSVPTPPTPPARTEGSPSRGDVNPGLADKVAAAADAANPKLDAAMAEANKAYDRFDYDEAKQLAQKVLARTPGNTRMLRILVSASCLSNDPQTAQTSYLLLPAGGPDRVAMKTRCQRDAGIELKEQ
jgi:hypothetical protein